MNKNSRLLNINLCGPNIILITTDLLKSIIPKKSLRKIIPKLLNYRLRMSSQTTTEVAQPNEKTIFFCELHTLLSPRSASCTMFMSEVTLAGQLCFRVNYTRVLSGLYAED